MQIKVVRVPGKAWTPDRSRGKRFRTRPRSARGTWELVIDGRKKKAPAKPKGQRNPISIQKLMRLARKHKAATAPTE
jgi:hypothetical protein